MCGRYYVDDEMLGEIRQVVRDIDRRLKGEVLSGDVRPSEAALILFRDRGEWCPVRMNWGFFGRDRGSLLINARAETVLEKPTFAESIRARRCVIPASGFYEWNAGKDKYTCFRPDRKTIYMAGCFRAYQGENRFVILTTAANESMVSIHERMPLLLPEEGLRGWLEEDAGLTGFLTREPEPLMKRTDYQQLSMDLFS